jgi:uncharacterized membrane protein
MMLLNDFLLLHYYIGNKFRIIIILNITIVYKNKYFMLHTTQCYKVIYNFTVSSSREDILIGLL